MINIGRGWTDKPFRIADPKAAYFDSRLPGEQFHMQMAGDSHFASEPIRRIACDRPTQRVPIEKIKRKSGSGENRADGDSGPAKDAHPGSPKPGKRQAPTAEQPDGVRRPCTCVLLLHSSWHLWNAFSVLLYLKRRTASKSRGSLDFLQLRCLGLRDIAVDDSIEHVERNAPAIQAGFVEILDVESRTQCGFGALEPLYPHRVADLVTAGLRRCRAVPLDFACHEARRVAFLIDKIPDRLLARPFHVMDARVDDATVGAEELEFQITDAAEWIVVIHADFVGELFGIERPAFAITGKSDRLSDQRHALVGEQQAALELMAGQAFVEHGCG